MQALVGGILLLSSAACSLGDGPEPVGYCEWVTPKDRERAQRAASEISASHKPIECGEDMLVAMFDPSLREVILDRALRESWKKAEPNGGAYCVSDERRAILIVKGGIEMQYAKEDFC